MVDAVSGKLLRGRSSKDKVTLDTGIDDLADNLLVREAYNKSVFGCVVLVLRLGDEAFASIVISLSLAAATVLDLESREVRVRLLLLHERHLC